MTYLKKEIIFVLISSLDWFLYEDNYVGDAAVRQSSLHPPTLINCRFARSLGLLSSAPFSCTTYIHSNPPHLLNILKSPVLSEFSFLCDTDASWKFNAKRGGCHGVAVNRNISKGKLKSSDRLMNEKRQHSPFEKLSMTLCKRRACITS